MAGGLGGRASTGPQAAKACFFPNSSPKLQASFPSTLKGTNSSTAGAVLRLPQDRGGAGVSPDAHQRARVSVRVERTRCDLRGKRAGVAPGRVQHGGRLAPTRLSSPRLPRAAALQALPVNESAPPAKGRVAAGSSRSRHQQRFFLEDRVKGGPRVPLTAQSPNGRLLYIS